MTISKDNNNDGIILLGSNNGSCGDNAGYGPNPTGSDNASANYNKNK